MLVSSFPAASAAPMSYYSASFIPAAPPLFSAPSRPAGFDSGFRAKATPNFAAHASHSAASAAHSPAAHLSPPPSGSSVSSPASGGPSSADAAWKARLKESCVQRVKQHRTQLIEKMRHLQPAAQPAAASSFFSAPASSSSAGPSSSAAAAQSSFLRGMIREEHARLMPLRRDSGKVSSAFGVPMSELVSSDGTDASELLSAEELEELVATLQDECQRTEGGPQFAAAASSPFYSTAASSFAAAASSSSMDDFADGRSSSAFDPAARLAQQYDADAAALLEADMAAYESAQQQETIPCPCCQRSLTVSAALGGSPSASCLCGLRYPVGSLSEFQQQLSDAWEVHSVRCQHAPRFVATAATASAAASASPPPSTLALACAPCHTWLSLPVVHAGGWHSAPSSQPESDEPQDADMTSI